jgi:hypothetical protein
MLAERRIVEVAAPAAFRRSQVAAVQEFLGAMPPLDSRAKEYV